MQGRDREYRSVPHRLCAGVRSLLGYRDLSEIEISSRNNGLGFSASSECGEKAFSHRSLHPCPTGPSAPRSLKAAIAHIPLWKGEKPCRHQHRSHRHSSVRSHARSNSQPLIPKPKSAASCAPSKSAWRTIAAPLIGFLQTRSSGQRHAIYVSGIRETPSSRHIDESAWRGAVLEGSRLEGNNPIAVWSVLVPRKPVMMDWDTHLPVGQDCVAVNYIVAGSMPLARDGRTYCLSTKFGR